MIASTLSGKEPANNGAAPIDALLFDLGRVVLRLDMSRTFYHWGRACGLPADILAGRFSVCEDYMAHERGEIDVSTYFDALRRRLQVDIDDAALTEGWNAIFVGLEPPVVQAITRLREHLPVYAFSNTNVTHRRYFTALYPQAMALFHHVFDSSELGLRKPEPAAFDKVIRAIGVPASRILFFDDLAENCAAGRAAGMQVVQVHSPDDVMRALEPLLARPAQ